MEHEISKKPSALISVFEMEENLPDLAKTSSQKVLHRNIISLLRRSFVRHNESEESPWPKLVRHLLYILTAALILAAITVIIYHSLLLDLIRVLSPPKLLNNGLTKIVASWAEPGTATPAPPSWLPNFSKDILPKPIHSHNDYWRPVPLFEALSLGVTGVEADCHLINGSLYVGHKTSSLRPNLTFRSLYLDPLFDILTNQNQKQNNSVTNSTTIKGVWDTHPKRSIVLMTDLKTEGFSTLEAVQQQLQPFREKGWLTYWNGNAVIPGPIIHVGTGNTPFSAVLNSTFANNTYRDVFFDAPLHALTPAYNISNSYYASTSLAHLFKGISFSGGLSEKKLGIVRGQVQQARELGLIRNLVALYPNLGFDGF
ncbi:hypothetical protein EG329_012694 [Mollisiaceae sp. DMI_Dod_QoI]|nr:hypothetical protein EG329_012694 [Helotiales sp. DMI_Dod_QoI]